MIHFYYKDIFSKCQHENGSPLAQKRKKHGKIRAWRISRPLFQYNTSDLFCKEKLVQMDQILCLKQKNIMKFC